jgi:hypothetical protein
VSPSTGDRYLVIATATGAWAGNEEKIASYNGSSWDFITPSKGYTVHDDESGYDLLYDAAYPAGTWVNIGVSVDHGSTLNLSWTNSGHTGTASRIAGFNGVGAAAVYQIGVDLQAYDATLAGLASTTIGAADLYFYSTGADAFTSGTITSFGRSLIDDTDSSAGRTTLGLVIGTNVQAYDATLAGLASTTVGAADLLIYSTGTDAFATSTITSFGRSLLDDTDAATARTTLGITSGTSLGKAYMMSIRQFSM